MLRRVASKGGQWAHVAQATDRRTVCGIRYALMGERYARGKPPCPKCTAILSETPHTDTKVS